MYKELISESGETTREKVSLTEVRLAVTFPASFIDFCMKFNGAKLNNAEIKALASNLGQTHYGVREFLPVEKIFNGKLEFLNETLVFFAEDSFGNFFAFNKSDMESIYFWDHEKNQIELVSQSFEFFLLDIYASDHNDLPDPKDAKVWIDPEFLKLQKDLGNA